MYMCKCLMYVYAHTDSCAISVAFVVQGCVMHVCWYVCMHVCMFVCVYVRKHTNRFIRVYMSHKGLYDAGCVIYVCTCVCMHVCVIPVYMYVCIYVYAQTGSYSIGFPLNRRHAASLLCPQWYLIRVVCASVKMHICTHIFFICIVCMNVQMHKRIYAYINPNKHTYIHRYIGIYRHTYNSTYIHR